MELDEDELFQIEEADEHGVRLEMIAGQPFWEFQPNFRHQSRIFRIASSLRPDPQSDTGGDCVQVSDVGIRFPDDSLRRPTSPPFAGNQSRSSSLRSSPKPSSRSSAAAHARKTSFSDPLVSQHGR